MLLYFFPFQTEVMTRVIIPGVHISSFMQFSNELCSCKAFSNKQSKSCSATCGGKETISKTEPVGAHFVCGHTGIYLSHYL